MKNSILRRAFLLLSLLLFPGMMTAYDGAVDYLLEGTVIYSGSESKALMAFDGDPATFYSTGSNALTWVGLDLGEPHVITRIDYMPVSGSMGGDRMLLGIFEGANSPDFMDALPLYLISTKPTSGSFARASINVSRGFRYVRYVGSTGSYCNVAELQFYGHAGEGDDSQFYQITNLPTLSIHVENNVLPQNRGEDFESQSVLIYEDGTMIQEYPILFRVRGNFSASHENKAFRMKYNDGKTHHVMRGGKNESPTKCRKWV
ncbi:MAG: discoidin domain-containing protein, partial [Bacteroidaceae bacterium]|nr:discoidin domain-containing protein [Bacteroidaceae bacterium]